MKKSPSPPAFFPIEGTTRHQFVFFITRKDYEEFKGKGGKLSDMLLELYGFSVAILMECVQDDEVGIAYHTYLDFPND